MSSRRLDAWCTGLTVLGGTLAALSLVDGGNLIAQIQAGAPVLAMLGLVLTGALLLRRRWIRAGVALVSSLVLLVPAITLPGDPPAPGGDTLSVLAFNTYVGQGDPDALMAEVRAREVDVLVLPEMTAAYWQSLVDRGIRDLLPHATGRTGGGRGMVVATREESTCVALPTGMTCGEVVIDESSEPYVLNRAGDPTFDQVVVRLPDGTLVKGVHLWSPRLSPGVRWREQQAEMARWIADQQGEELLVLAGDFNAGRSHPAFREYSAGFDDSPRGAFPWTRTWPKWGPIGPLTQIDHVLARGRRAAESTTLRIPGSDHDAVWSLLTR